jgi:maltooligosyltrehalose trehalohydrolase
MTVHEPWHPTIGAVARTASGTTFRVWAPTSRAVELVVERPDGSAELRTLAREAHGVFTGTFPDLGPGIRYRFQLDGDGPFPDPASRYQPDGVHGASMSIDPCSFRWSDLLWSGVPLHALVLYELHVGTFSEPGTFVGATERLPQLRDLGITGIELMPVADFPGARNWGYDGVALFAPARCYGTPDELRRLVDTAHGMGMAVLMDVVYNHTGPDGSYLSRFSPYYFTTRHTSPWGQGVDLDGDHSAQVREFFIENALHWIHEYHMDGLRLDATHAIQDEGPRHFLAELTARVRASVTGRQIHLIAEDHRNLAMMVTPQSEFGWGLDAVWADDFHHQMRRLLAGDRDGYYRDFSGTTRDLAATLRQGWFFTGQHSEHLNEPRGTDPSSIPPARFVVCLQNHDQIGNRAHGERLHHQIDAAAFRAASVVLLAAPQTPLLFMGQEWGASNPFQYFTDHAEPLGRLVTEGRRREFRDFAAFTGDAAGTTVPDPQALATFLASRLDWSEREIEPHASVVRLYTALLTWRRREFSTEDDLATFTAQAFGETTLLMSRTSTAGVRHLVVACLRGTELVDLDGHELAVGAIHGWVPILTSDDPQFGAIGASLEVLRSGLAPIIRFAGPGAVILKTVVTRSATWAGTAESAMTAESSPRAMDAPACVTGAKESR